MKLPVDGNLSTRLVRDSTRPQVVLCVRAAQRRFRNHLRAIVPCMLAASDAAAQRSVIRATVVDSRDSSSINATAVLDRRGVKRTSSGEGLVSFAALTPGRYELVVRAIGYQPLTLRIQLAPNDTVSGTLLMTRVQETLDTVAVHALRIPPMFARRLQEFDSRRAAGLGRFLDWTFFQERRDRGLGSVLNGRIPGLTVRRFRNEERLITNRNGSTCIPQGVVNGIIVESLDLSTISTDEVLGLEFYTPSTTPPQYNRTGSGISGAHCGTVVLWLK